MNRSTFRVPLIFPEKFYFVANLERVNARCQVNIVGDQECLARSQLDDKSLMPAAVIIVREQPSDRSVSLYLSMALAVCKGTSQTLVTLATLVIFANSRRCIDPGGRRRYARGSASKNGGKTDNQDKQT
ncbi:MAG TPA: hypothetical protein VL866_07740 [Pyrinomonadaceae bacterium]|nr:hypothetical protein [Pyrinomonadaceae bacterium]